VLVPEYAGEEMLEPVGAEVSTLTTTVEDSEHVAAIVVVVTVVEVEVVEVEVVEVDIVVVAHELHLPLMHKPPQGRE